MECFDSTTKRGIKLSGESLILLHTRPRTAPLVRRFQITVNMLPAIEITVLLSHQTIQHVARRVDVFAALLIPQAPLLALHTSPKRQKTG